METSEDEMVSGHSETQASATPVTTDEKSCSDTTSSRGKSVPWTMSTAYCEAAMGGGGARRREA
eukprot:4999518-Prymnesium_polylepis.1